MKVFVHTGHDAQHGGFARAVVAPGNKDSEILRRISFFGGTVLPTRFHGVGVLTHRICTRTEAGRSGVLQEWRQLFDKSVACHSGAADLMADGGLDSVSMIRLIAGCYVMSESLNWDVVDPFVWKVRVSEEDTDRFGHTNNVVYLSWLEKAAWGHSDALGMSFETYERLDRGCVARRHELDYLLPTFAGDELAVATWVAENDGRLTMWRGYQIIRVADGKTVMRGRTQWVCVDLSNGRPRRQPPEFIQAYRPAQVRP